MPLTTRAQQDAINGRSPDRSPYLPCDSASAAPPIAPRISSVTSLLNTILLCIMSVAADALAVSAWQKLKVTIFPFSFILALLFVIRPAFFYPEFLPATLKNASGIISDDPSTIGSYPRNH